MAEAMRMDFINDMPAVPKAVGPYSQAVGAGGWLFCSGQIAIDPQTGTLGLGGVEAQTRQVLVNVEALLRSQGLGMDAIVKTTLFLTNMADFSKVNAIYQEAMGAHRPARSTVAVSALPLGAAIEIEVIAQR